MGGEKRERKVGLALFGLPFFAIGVGFLLFSVIPSLYESQQMAGWPVTTGTLSFARLNSHTSDGSTTYGVEARYSYRVAGRDYTNDRVAINSGSDNVGHFQQQLGSRLERLYRNHQPVTVYYNPANPAEAVLDRTLRWGLLGLKMIFVVAFGGAGLGMLIFGLRGKRIIDTPEAQSKPWLKNPDWAENRIRSGARSGTIGIWFFAILWNAISSPIPFVFTEVLEEKGALAYLMLLFPLVGILVLVSAIRKSLEWRRFGYTPLTLDPFPGAIGGDVGGEIALNIPYDPQLACEVTLSSLHSYVSGSGKNRSRQERVEWQDSGYARVARSARGMKLQFRFAVPGGQRASEEQSDNYYFWRLTIHSAMPGVDLDRTFEIPVYATGERARGLNIDSAQENPPGVARPTAEAILPLSRQGMTTKLYYPMFRRVTPGITGLLFGTLFGGVGMVIFAQAKDVGIPLYFMGSIFSLVGSAIVLGSLYSLLNALRIELDGRRITMTRLVLGIPIRRKETFYHDVQSVELKKGSITTQQGNKHQINYKVIAHTLHGELLLAEQLDTHSKAKLAVEFFSKTLRLKTEERKDESEFVLEVE